MLEPWPNIYEDLDLDSVYCAAGSVLLYVYTFCQTWGSKELWKYHVMC